MTPRNCCLLLLLLVLALPSSAWGYCAIFNAGVSDLTIQLPDDLGMVRDAPVGTELWSSGWVQAPGLQVGCSGPTTSVSGTLAAGIGTSVQGMLNSKGEPYVYQTNIEGIGISVYFHGLEPGLGPPPLDPLGATPLTARYAIPQPTGFDWMDGIVWWVRLVKTGPASAGGQLQIPGISVANLQNGTQTLNIARLYLIGAPTLTAKACEVDVDSRHITVPLPAVRQTDFGDSAGPLADSSKARAFGIGLQCDAGVAVRYRIDGPRAAGVSDVLANATGPAMAPGVGVQLFKGDTGSTTVQPLGVMQPHAVTTQDAEVVRIPLTAKYYRTAPQASGVGPGAVSATATFTLSYE